MEKKKNRVEKTRVNFDTFDADYQRLRKRVYFELRKYGKFRLTDDVAQSIMLKRLEGKGKKQLVSHAVIDVLREMKEMVRERRKKPIELYLEKTTHYLDGSGKYWKLKK